MPASHFARGEEVNYADSADHVEFRPPTSIRACVNDNSEKNLEWCILGFSLLDMLLE